MGAFPTSEGQNIFYPGEAHFSRCHYNLKFAQRLWTVDTYLVRLTQITLQDTGLRTTPHIHTLARPKCSCLVLSNARASNLRGLKTVRKQRKSHLEMALLQARSSPLARMQRSTKHRNNNRPALATLRIPNGVEQMSGCF